MRTLITVHLRGSGAPAAIDPDRMAAVLPADVGSNLLFDGGHILEVRETPAHIMRAASQVRPRSGATPPRSALDICRRHTDRLGESRR